MNKSNSFTNGLLKVAGIPRKNPLSKVPGWNKPVPNNLFGVGG